MVAKRIILTVEDVENKKDQTFWEELVEDLVEDVEKHDVEVVAELEDAKGVKGDGKKKR